jgi:hypothetical protein
MNRYKIHDFKRPVCHPTKDQVWAFRCDIDKHFKLIRFESGFVGDKVWIVKFNNKIVSSHERISEENLLMHCLRIHESL